MIGEVGEVADEMQRWVDGHACDGFIFQPTHLPGGFDEDLRAQGDAALFDMLEEYSIVRDRKPIMGIDWSRAAFLDGDNPGSAPPPQSPWPATRPT